MSDPNPKIPIVPLGGRECLIQPHPEFFFGSDADPADLVFAALTPQPRDPRYGPVPRSLVIIEQLPSSRWNRDSVLHHRHLAAFTLN